MSRSRSVASQEVVLKLPQEVMREYRGKRPRQGESDALGNGPVQAPLAKAAIKELARRKGIDGDFVVAGDGSIEEAD